MQVQSQTLVVLLPLATGDWKQRQWLLGNAGMDAGIDAIIPGIGAGIGARNQGIGAGIGARQSWNWCQEKPDMVPGNP